MLFKVLSPNILGPGLPRGVRFSPKRVFVPLLNYYDQANLRWVFSFGGPLNASGKISNEKGTTGLTLGNSTAFGNEDPIMHATGGFSEHSSVPRFFRALDGLPGGFSELSLLVSIWVSPFTSGNYYFLDVGNNTRIQFFSSNSEVQLQYDTFKASDGTIPTSNTLWGTHTAVKGGWMTFGYSLKGGASKRYVNGVLVQTNATPWDNLRNASSTVNPYFGTAAGFSNTGLNGRMGTFHKWDAGITDLEMKEAHNGVRQFAIENDFEYKTLPLAL